MATRIQLRRDTAANWAANNPVLAQGEPSYETDTGIEKIGDGVTDYNSLPPKASSETAASIKSKYESNEDTNAFTDAEKSDLANLSGLQVPKTWYVSSTGSDITGTGGIAKPYLTIAYAISQAASGDIINISAGSFVEPITINKSITLIGASGRSVISGVNTTIVGNLTIDTSLGSVYVQLKNVTYNVSSHTLSISGGNSLTWTLFDSTLKAGVMAANFLYVYSSEIYLFGNWTIAGQIVAQNSRVLNVGTYTLSGGAEIDIQNTYAKIGSIIQTSAVSGTITLKNSFIDADITIDAANLLQQNTVIVGTITANGSGTVTVINQVPDLTGYSLKSNVLELDNTIPFTPDADYEPATKKYVDENGGSTVLANNPYIIAMNTTTADGQYTGLAIQESFIGSIMPIIGGIPIPVGDAVKTEASYWSRDSGTTALALSALQIGDELYWNGSIAGDELDSTIKGSLLFGKSISGSKIFKELPHLVALEATTADEEYSGITLSETPEGVVMVVIGSLFIPVGDAVKTEAAYWSRDSGVTALSISALQAGDQLYWNGSIAGFELSSSIKGSTWYMK